MKLDETDIKILNILQTDAHITNLNLAKEVGISPPTMLERVRRLESSGIIKKYIALVDAEKVGQNITAFVQVSLAVHQMNSVDEFRRSIDELDEVLECYHISGEDDFLLKVTVRSIKEYERFVLEKLSMLKGVSKVKTNFCLSVFKHETKLTIERDDNE
ncbi:MAG: Leucine-responsive regulatory protein [Ignavibacteriaceae bacterium]|nr:Leucine-responsive regulatory protein [Ignavibacteriaceae bacterium]